MNKKTTYLISIITPLLLGGIVGFIISPSIDYSSLQKPFLAPPSITFPIVWSILYLLMGISYGILKSNNLTDSKIDLIYYTQLVFNLLWPSFGGLYTTNSECQRFFYKFYKKHGD